MRREAVAPVELTEALRQLDPEGDLGQTLSVTREASQAGSGAPNPSGSGDPSPDGSVIPSRAGSEVPSESGGNPLSRAASLVSNLRRRFSRSPEQSSSR